MDDPFSPFDRRFLGLPEPKVIKSTVPCRYKGPEGIPCGEPSVLFRVEGQTDPYRCPEHRLALSYVFECEAVEHGQECGKPATEWEGSTEDEDTPPTLFRCDYHAEKEGLVGEAGDQPDRV